MSFEGYYQILCERGHLSSHGANEEFAGIWSCPSCRTKVPRWFNLVDDTNCDEYGKVVLAPSGCDEFGSLFSVPASKEQGLELSTPAEQVLFHRPFLSGLIYWHLMDVERRILRQGNDFASAEQAALASKRVRLVKERLLARYDALAKSHKSVEEALSTILAEADFTGNPAVVPLWSPKVEG